MVIPKFMKTKEWFIFVSIMRILTFIGIVILIFILVTEIESVKLLANDACKVCMNKTGAICMLPPSV